MHCVIILQDVLKAENRINLINIILINKRKKICSNIPPRGDSRIDVKSVKIKLTGSTDK